MKDWVKSGYAVKVIEALPEYDVQFITAEDLLENLRQTEERGTCTAENGQPFLTLLDFRTDHFFSTGNQPPEIKTNCNIIKLFVDDLSDPDKRKSIPLDSPVVTVTETGNRDKEAIRFLSKFGYTNVEQLKFGMRGWIKQDYPTTLKH